MLLRMQTTARREGSEAPDAHRGFAAHFGAGCGLTGASVKCNTHLMPSR